MYKEILLPPCPHISLFKARYIICFPAWWAVWLPLWPPARCNIALMYHEFLILLYCCVMLEIKLTTTTTKTTTTTTTTTQSSIGPSLYELCLRWDQSILVLWRHFTIRHFTQKHMWLPLAKHIQAFYFFPNNIFDTKINETSQVERTEWAILLFSAYRAIPEKIRYGNCRDC